MPSTQPGPGNHKLKRALFLSWFAALHGPAGRAYYTETDEGKKRNAALICLDRRCGVLHAMLKSKEPYRLPEAAKA